MRLERLDLVRYGKFTDERISFGPVRPGQPDLHIIYGPNEAGKTTAFTALLDLLFGIEPSTTYHFLHPHAALRLGAALQIDGAVQEVVRMGKPRGLLDARDQPLPEGLFLNDLAGLDRAAYKTMFSLDDDTLEKGGESILASKGDLGQLLFSASAGLAEFSQTLATLRNEADGFFKSKGRTHELGELKKVLGTLKERRDAIDTLASAYGRLTGLRDAASAAYEAAVAERADIQARLDAARRCLNAQPRMVEMIQARAELESVRALPAIPAGWSEALPALQKAEVEIETQHVATAQEVQRLSDDIADVGLDPEALRLAERLKQSSGLRARYTTAVKDLPERRLALAEATAVVARILQNLGRAGEPEPGKLVLPAATVGRLRACIESRSGIDAALAEAARQLSDAERVVAAARDGSGLADGDDDEPPRDFAALAATLPFIESDDHGPRQRLAARTGEAQRAVLAERLLVLAPWSGDAEALARLVAPESVEVERWKARLNKAQTAQERRLEANDRLATEKRLLDAEIAAIEATAPVLTDLLADSTRRARDAAWQAHRGALDAATADVFERTLRADDESMQARTAHAQDLARLTQAKRARAMKAVETQEAEARLAAASSSLLAIETEIAAAMAAVAPGLAHLPIAAFEAWLARRARALETRAALQQAEADRRGAVADGLAMRARACAALTAAGVAHDGAADLDTLLGIARTAIGQAAEHAALRNQRAGRERTLAERRAAAEKAVAADRVWQAEWMQVCAETWLATETGAPALAVVREALVHLTELGPALDREAGLADRIAKMEKDQEAFAAEIAAIAGELGLPESDDASPMVANRLELRIQQALLDQAARAAKTKDRDAALRRQAETTKAITTLNAKKVAMAAHFGVETLAEVAVSMQASLRRSTLLGRCVALEAELLGGLGVATLEAAEALLASVDRETLEREATALKTRFEDQEGRVRSLFAERSKAADAVEAVGGDAEAARLEEARRTVLLDIEDKAVRYLSLRAGILAAEQALRAYRDRHRSSMMARASESFQALTRGAYTGLVAQAAKEAETLVGLVAGGGSRLATEMSKGTRFQLYLALRVAGYYEFAKTRRTVPFVADDIMETFDDFRAEETFRLFADMARIGQVIYLTHHRHLCDIAQQVCPTVTIHELGARKRMRLAS